RLLQKSRASRRETNFVAGAEWPAADSGGYRQGARQSPAPEFAAPPRGSAKMPAHFVARGSTMLPASPSLALLADPPFSLRTATCGTFAAAC
ncbi:MAG: hypothetical protein ACKO1J_14450, partial [Tagaea sp.]